MDTRLRASPRSLWILAALFFLTPFQNCGHFEANVLAQASSAQCRVNLASQALRSASAEGRYLACTEPSSYACERRVFGPNEVDGAVEAPECPGGDGFCVDVLTRHFATAAARDGRNVAQFQPGGDYNHVESRCYHRWIYQGQTVLENEAATLTDALANVRQACAQAQGETK